MFRERSDEQRYTVAALDLVLGFVAFAIAFAFRFAIVDPSFSDYRGIEPGSYLIFGILLALVQTVVLALLGLYRHQKFLAFLDEAGTLMVGVLLNIVISFAVLYYLRIYQVSRILPLFYGIILLVMLFFGHQVFRRILIRRRRKGLGYHDLLIVGSNPMALKTAQTLEANILNGYKVRGYVVEDPEDFRGVVEPEKILGTLGDLESLLQNNPPHDIIYTGVKDYQGSLLTVLESCDRHGVHLHVVPDFGDMVNMSGTLESLDGLHLFSIRDIPARVGLNRLAKRTFDIVFSGLFILVFSPLFLLVALSVKLTSKGPVFFLQERVGLDNKVFKIIKFRTMRVQTTQASDTVWTTKNDPRITPVGRFLRKTSLDEIPQFFNIFIGQMSVVGPRPERPFYVEQFRDKYKYFKRRHAVKAGLTGWAQIKGLRGDTSIQDRIDADIYYIENWTLYLDLKIVALTPFKGMISKNAY